MAKCFKIKWNISGLALVYTITLLTTPENILELLPKLKRKFINLQLLKKKCYQVLKENENLSVARPWKISFFLKYITRYNNAHYHTGK